LVATSADYVPIDDPVSRLTIDSLTESVENYRQILAKLLTTVH
jgi:hypothetical protein